MPAQSPEIANRFIQMSLHKGEPLTNMQLQKLVYISHGWALAVFKQGLTVDAPEAWPYGPVYANLYYALRQYGPRGVDRLITRGDWELFPDDEEEESLGFLSSDEKNLLSKVFEIYGGFAAFKLSALTHVKGTPWDTVYNDYGMHRSAIPDHLIQKHFEDIAKSGKQNAQRSHVH